VLKELGSQLDKLFNEVWRPISQGIRRESMEELGWPSMECEGLV
jgi:hypothetical protein